MYPELFQDASAFHKEFAAFMETADVLRRIYAVVTVGFTTELQGETLAASTVLTTTPSLVRGSSKAWWRVNVEQPVERFLGRFEDGDVTNISYHYK